MYLNRKKLSLAFWLVLVLFAFFTSATYAWMSIASDMKVTDMALTVLSESGLEIAPDVNGSAGEWTTVINMADPLSGSAVLRPVTYSQTRQAFLVPRYGWDGRADFSDPLLLLRTGTASSSSDEAEEGEGTGYLYTLKLWVRTGGGDCAVKLSEPKQVTKGGIDGGGTCVVGKPVWKESAVRHEDGGYGAENAVRLAFRTYDEPDGSKGRFVIYEPNADSGGSYKPTAGLDGTQGLISPDALILQAASGWSEQNPVLRDNVNYSVGAFLSDNRDVFTLKTGVARRVTVYIWLEGQDPDCGSEISAADILVNIQFSADTAQADNPIVAR